MCLREGTCEGIFSSFGLVVLIPIGEDLGSFEVCYGGRRCVGDGREVGICLAVRVYALSELSMTMMLLRREHGLR